MQMVKTAGATSQQGVSSESTFFNLGYTLEKVKIFNFSLNAVIASVRLIQDCQLKYRLITYGELSRRHWYSGSLVGDSLLPFKPSNPLPIQLVRGCSIYKVIRSYVRACWWGNVQSKKSKFPSCNLCILDKNMINFDLLTIRGITISCIFPVCVTWGSTARPPKVLQLKADTWSGGGQREAEINGRRLK